MKQDTDTSFSRPLVIKNRQYDIGRFFSSMPAIVLFALIVVCYAVVVALGVIIGYQKFLGNIKVADSPIETAVAAVFGLLAFMLAFTFSLTWSRFANRNVLVIAQAQAIGTCYLRTSLITEKQKNEVRMLLYEYTNILVRLPGHADLHKSLDRLDEIHLLIWKQTATLGKEDIDSELRSLFISSVNELISIPVQRKTVALTFRIPDIIWGSLLFLAFVGMLAFGYQAGVNGMRRLLQLPWLPVAFGLIIVLIADLNSSSSQRNFKVTQQPLLDVLKMMESDII
ncbi:MAG: hypothetical protein E6H09_14345 [Bacteroidetes bacterium]|jgi:uncharacterized membrane protein (DUF485 family)|nr:MAG: hypothetical protein E6H09_14345 [Bacteroidota bacterium]